MCRNVCDFIGNIKKKSLKKTTVSIHLIGVRTKFTKYVIAIFVFTW